MKTTNRFGRPLSAKAIAAKIARKARITPIPVSVKSTAKPYRLEFEIRGLPPMANASGGSRQFFTIKNERDLWLNAVKRLIRLHLPVAPLKRARLTLHRHSSVEPDYDGLVHGFKAVIDAMVGKRKKGEREFLVLADDKITNTGKPDFDWIPARQGEGKIFVIVEEVESTPKEKSDEK